jgi:hypothetical protein
MSASRFGAADFEAGSGLELDGSVFEPSGFGFAVPVGA